jgi:exonuclease III
MLAALRQKKVEENGAGQRKTPHPARGRQGRIASSAVSLLPEVPVVRLITWNVARRVRTLAEQAAALGERKPDVIALQEVTDTTLPLWEAACATIGLPHVACTLRDAEPDRAPATRRRTGVLLAARSPLAPLAGVLPVPWPETALTARVEGVEVHTVHVPNAANGEIKAVTLAAIRAGVTARNGPRVVCGDLNTPRRELPDGTVWSFARDGRGRVRAERAGFWDEAELGIVPGLRDLGFTDAFRALHGYAERSPSWTFRRISGHGGGWRLDHVFCSAELAPVACAYHHDWRDEGLSDHSALEADLSAASHPPPPPRGGRSRSRRP